MAFTAVLQSTEFLFHRTGRPTSFCLSAFAKKTLSHAFEFRHRLTCHKHPLPAHVT
jgi:hypothetical protein